MFPLGGFCICNSHLRIFYRNGNVTPVLKSTAMLNKQTIKKNQQQQQKKQAMTITIKHILLCVKNCGLSD